MTQVNNENIPFSAAHCMSADAQGHIRAEAVRFLTDTGTVITDDAALELIVGQHADLHRLIPDCLPGSALHIDSSGALIFAIEHGDLRLVDPDEDTALLNFRYDVLAALQDPKACQSMEALHSRIGGLGIAQGWWKKREATTGATV